VTEVEARLLEGAELMWGSELCGEARKEVGPKFYLSCDATVN
jgi:hypothetical protein